MRKKKSRKQEIMHSQFPLGWKQNQKRSRVPSDPIVNHTVRDHMRRIVVTWLFEVIDEFEQPTCVAHLAANYMDRTACTGEIKITAQNYQLVAIASLMIASKFVTSNPLNCENLIWISGDAFSRKALIAMEASILRVLNWDIAVWPLEQFLDFYLVGKPARIRPLALALANCSLLSTNIICEYSPEHIAKSIIYYLTENRSSNCIVDVYNCANNATPVMKDRHRYDLKKISPPCPGKRRKIARSIVEEVTCTA
jgi:hypothetical protein